MITTQSITANLKSKKVEHTNRRGSRLKIGEIQVTEQIDALYMLRTHPVDYLVVPRVISGRAFKLYIQGGRDTPQDLDFF